VRNRLSFAERRLAAISLSIPDGLFDSERSGWTANRTARRVSDGNAPSGPATQYYEWLSDITPATG